MMQSFARSVSPVLASGLTVLWLVLNQSVAPGHIVLGVLLGVMIAWAGSTLRPLQAKLRRIDVAMALLLVALFDVMRSNLNVARIVLGLSGRRPINSTFLDIPVDLKDPHGLAALAAILTSTPGTVWVGMSADGKWLRLHVLDLMDEEHWIHVVKYRYEARLIRIFE